MQNYRAALYDKQPSHMCPTEFTTYSDAKIVESMQVLNYQQRLTRGMLTQVQVIVFNFSNLQTGLPTLHSDNCPLPILYTYALI